MTDKKIKTGKVFIIGAGPGDAGLITLKAVEALLAVDVVVYDNLVNEELLKFAPSQAKFIYAGKKGGDHTLSQDRINELLVRRRGRAIPWRASRAVILLSLGAVAEAQMLAKNDIAFEIIPGVTSATAVPAYAGIRSRTEASLRPWRL